VAEAAIDDLVRRQGRVEDLPGLLHPEDREAGRIEQPDLDERRRLVPVDEGMNTSR
jgi:hypothetical protein